MYIFQESEADIEDFMQQKLEADEGVSTLPDYWLKSNGLFNIFLHDYFPLQPTDDKVRWQKVLYTKIGGVERTNVDQHHVLERILSMAKVMHGLHMVGTSFSLKRTCNVIMTRMAPVP